MSCTTDTPLEVTAGFVNTIPMTLDDGTDPVNLTGATIYFTGKRSLADADEDAVFALAITSHTSPTTGESEAEIDLTAADDTVLAAGERIIGQVLVIDSGDVLIYDAKFPIQINPTVLRAIPA